MAKPIEIIKSLAKRGPIAVICTLLIAVTIAFWSGFYSGSGRKPAPGSFHDMIVNHPHDLSGLITPKDSRIRALASGLKTPQNAFFFVRDRIEFDPSSAALPAGDILTQGRASCLGKAVLLCSLYRAMGLSSAEVRVVTGEVESPYGAIDHAWVEMEYDGTCIQQDATSLLGSFGFDQFKGKEYTSSFIHRELSVFNDTHFAIVSQLNLLQVRGHPPVE
jgi:hypothetical protein